MLDQAESLRKLVNNEKNNIRSNSSKKTRVITVTSGKGGVGKSNFVVNLSVLLQQRGKKVLIFDADIGMGNDDVLMGVYPKNNIFDIIFTGTKIKDIIIEGPCGVNLISGGSGLNKVGELTENEKMIFLSELEAMEDYDYLIMDTGAGVNKDILSFISAAEDLIVVTTPEPTSLTDAYSLIKTTDYFKLNSNVKIVVNRTFTRSEGQETFERISRAVNRFLDIKVEYIGCIMDDRKLVQSVRLQKPCVLAYPSCDAAKSIESIAMNILGEKNIQSDGVKNLFRKLFNVFS